MDAPGLSLKKRLLFLLFVFTFLVVGMLVRVSWIQVVKGDWYQEMAFIQQNSGIEVSARRGTILDRNGKVLAVSASVETIAVNPQEVRRSGNPPEKLAQRLSEFIGMDEEVILKKITKRSRFEYIKRRVDKDVGNAIREWKNEENIEGIYIVEDAKRFYPNRNLAAHVVGFTNVDNEGLYGIEARMEDYLRGTPGKILSEVDAKGREMPFSVDKHIAPKDGLNVVLTLDETIQYMATKVIEKAIDDNNVLRGAAAIVMDPRNGDILALVSKPDFDLNNPRGAPLGVDPTAWKGTTGEEIKLLQETVWRNKVVTDTYEPGSTFKAVTSAAGLEEKVVTPETRVNDFTVTVGGWPIHCWKPNAHGEEYFYEGVYNSCNPVFVRVAQDLGVDKFYKYVRSFGFYDRTGINLPGEARSIIHKKPTEVDMATASFGQRFQITPIQLIRAYGAIANGGKLMKPRLVKEVTDTEGNVVEEFPPEVVKTAISKETADTLKQILEGVVSVGTGKNAYVKGYRVAGKTGTSETTEKGRYIASFSAFAPADDPQICALVILDYPDCYPHTGGMIAAPVAGKLVEDVLNYLEVERVYSERDKEMIREDVYVPDVRNKTIGEAKKAFKEFGLEYKVEGQQDQTEAVVLEQMPKPGASIPEKSVVILYTEPSAGQSTVSMPNVLNMTVEEATKALNEVGLNLKVDGMGTAIKQEYEPGAEVPKGKVVEVQFRHLVTE